MKWSYYRLLYLFPLTNNIILFFSSMVMRDFTLRSSPQFGSLVIIRMFLDELVTHIIVNKLQKPAFSMKNIDIKSGRLKSLNINFRINFRFKLFA